MIASANGTLPANPRQIFYAARPRSCERPGLQKIDSKYFTQTLLPDFMNDNPDADGGAGTSPGMTGDTSRSRTPTA